VYFAASTVVERRLAVVGLLNSLSACPAIAYMFLYDHFNGEFEVLFIIQTVAYMFTMAHPYFLFIGSPATRNIFLRDWGCALNVGNKVSVVVHVQANNK
jgi:hypothetical protein